MVRLIAPLLQGKAVDPAIVVIDEAGQFAISLCSGHQGGADQLTHLVACQLGATPVLTGAASHLRLPGVDVLGVPFGWQRGGGDWTGVSAAMARQAPVQVIQSAGSTLWREQLSAGHSFYFSPATDGMEPDAIAASAVSDPQARIWIGPQKQSVDATSSVPEVQWYPRLLWLGIGCERNTSRQTIEADTTEPQEH